MVAKQGRSKVFLFRFRLATLLWVMFSVGCFFAGRYWEQIEFIRPASKVTGTTVKLAVGQSVVISRKAQIPRELINNPEFVKAVAISANQIQLNGISPGRTTANLWDENGALATYSIVVRP